MKKKRRKKNLWVSEKKKGVKEKLLNMSISTSFVVRIYTKMTWRHR